MEISNERVEEYMAIYFEEYGQTIEKAQARIELTALVSYMEAVYKFINKINYE